MQEGTIVYPVADGRVLLIEKKRGVGAGFYNGPGGKVEPGETPREAAKREVREEIGTPVPSVDKRGVLEFVFGDEHFMTAHVYRAPAPTGEPVETAEARPEWFALDAVPYDEMWEDDRHWLPHVLEGHSVRGWFRFDAAGEQMRGWSVTVDDTG
ncbi:MAG: 8-oxo-dGTP diphosphatase [Halanaeroarchaeum sp.]